MPLELYLAFVLATAILIVMPGPNVTLIVANSMTYGARHALVTVAGTQAAQAIQLAAVVIGMASLLNFTHGSGRRWQPAPATATRVMRPWQPRVGRDKGRVAVCVQPAEARAAAPPRGTIDPVPQPCCRLRRTPPTLPPPSNINEITRRGSLVDSLQR